MYLGQYILRWRGIKLIRDVDNSNLQPVGPLRGSTRRSPLLAGFFSLDRHHPENPIKPLYGVQEQRRARMPIPLYHSRAGFGPS